MTDTCSKKQGGRVASDLSGLNIVVGITGGIAAYKAADYIRAMKGRGAAVIPVLTEAATRFITPLTLSALTGARAMTDLFDPLGQEDIPHINLARQADIFLVMPATANIIAKAANGIADDLLSTLILAYKGPVIFAPSMNPSMYENEATQENLRVLTSRGHQVIQPGEGSTACGETGVGRLATFDTILYHLLKQITPKDLKGKRILITAGPTREAIDPVRYVSNRSSGKMGYHLATAASLRGADVTLVSGPVCLPPPAGAKTIYVESAKDMFDAVRERASGCDVAIMAAAVADFTPSDPMEEKIKKGTSGHIDLHMEKTPDILAFLGRNKQEGQVVVGFCAETSDLLSNAKGKLVKKRADLMVANDVSLEGVGFDHDTNQVTIIRRDFSGRTTEIISKQEVAHIILDEVAAICHTGPSH